MENPKKNARTFTRLQKNKCWNNAREIEGRDPKRWRLDAVGNPVLKCLRGCFGPLCHEYDHIIPYSKGGKTKTKNCQILQTRINRAKSDNIVSSQELTKTNSIEYLSEREKDLIEYALYGNISKNAQ